MQFGILTEKSLKMLKQYRFGFDHWGVVLFLLVMLPTFIWRSFRHWMMCCGRLERKNLHATVFAVAFAICHTAFAGMNFMV